MSFSACSSIYNLLITSWQPRLDPLLFLLFPRATSLQQCITHSSSLIEWYRMQ